MSQVLVRIPTPLRGLTGGANQIEVQAATPREALIKLERERRGPTARVLDPHGELHPFVNP